MHIENLNRSKPQCPVGLKTLVFPSSSTAYLQMQMHQQILQQQFQSSKNYNLSTSSSSSEDRVPMVYLECGHVHGQHNWGVKNDNNDRECPLCRKVFIFLTYSTKYQFLYYSFNSGGTLCKIISGFRIKFIL